MYFCIIVGTPKTTFTIQLISSLARSAFKKSAGLVLFYHRYLKMSKLIIFQVFFKPSGEKRSEELVPVKPIQNWIRFHWKTTTRKFWKRAGFVDSIHCGGIS